MTRGTDITELFETHHINIDKAQAYAAVITLAAVPLISANLTSKFYLCCCFLPLARI